MSLPKVLFVVFALSLLACSRANAQSPLSRNAAIAESLRLTEEQRYADAVAMAQQMKSVAPSDQYRLETQGAVALEVGAISVAGADFHDALVRNPNDPIALFGGALTQMLENHNGEALHLIGQIDQTSLPPDVRTEVSVAQAACAAETGKSVQALADVDGTSDPAGDELAALVTFRETESNTGVLEACLAKSLVGGIPNVIESPGIRLVLPPDDKGPAIEPSIVDPEIQQNLAARFNPSSAGDNLKTVSGTISVTPPRSLPDGTTSVSMSVDDLPAGETSSPPYSFNWDTKSVFNGAHSLTFLLLNALGAQIGIQVEYLSVLNATESADDLGPLPQDLLTRIWNAMRIKPDYKVVEYELALASLRVHDEEGYETHILRAAALDPDYLDVRNRIHPLFIGQVPDSFPVPDGTHLPSSLGLSAGTASRAGFWAGSSHIREMALTFDDGPLPGPNAQLLKALRDSNAHGTFFVVGMRAAESPDSLRQMAADGNAVEDHTYTHPNLTQILPQHILQEILRTAVVIQAATGLWPHFLRPPGGNTNTLVLETAKACGMSGAFWTIDALPAEEAGSPEGVVNWVVSRARPGAIVLMHNGMDATIAAVPDLVKQLRQKGYKLVTIRQLAADALNTPHSGT